jgi:TolB protein
MHHMAKHGLHIILLTFLIVCSLGVSPCKAEYDYIDITNPFLRKSPLAIPQFTNLTEDASGIELSRKASDLLSETLEFTGYFRIIDRQAFLVEEDKVDLSEPGVNFGSWTGIGAELLITGGLVVTNEIAEMELRLYDTFKETLIIGKRYKGWGNDYRRMIRRFASEVVHHISGSRGFFNSRIAFLSNGSGHKEIYISEFDGFNPIQHTHGNTIILSPSWSSDGKWLAYTSYAKDNPDLYIRHVTEKRGAILSKKGVNIAPSWVPGQFALGATLSYSGDQEIYLLTGSGKIIKRLTYNRGIDVSPSFSPDGKKMAFVSKRSGTPQIHIMDLESKEVRRLTFHGRYNTQCSWSPRGERIAYTGLKDGLSNIYVTGVDGKGLIQLTQDAGDNESPSWSPEGSLLVFSSTREGSSRIYIMTAFGSDQRRLLVLPGEQSDPQWSPNLVNNPQLPLK